MTSSPWPRLLGRLLAGGVCLAAISCSDQAAAPPFSGGGTQTANIDVTDGDTVTVCKVGPSGSFGTFTVTQSGPGDGVLLVSSPFTVSAGSCLDVWTDNTGEAIPDPINNVVVTETGTSSGTQFDSLVAVPDAGVPTLLAPNSVQVTVNFNHGAKITMFNSLIPPQGKTFSIGPSSMEGAIKISNGDWVNGGYSFKFKDGSHAATNFTVAATVSITGPCLGGGPATDTFTLTLPAVTYAVAAGNTNWLPTGDANSVLSWQGSAIASGVCGGIGQLDARKGAVFTATVAQNPVTGSLVDFRFKYRDPAAKGKPNTNCLDTSDPNRNKADVCGASWSQTVTDP